MKRFSILGAGNLGTYLCRSLVDAGFRLTGIYKKSKFDLFPESVTNNLAHMVEHSDFVVIATQESKIEEAAKTIAQKANPRGKIFFHTSNALTSQQLQVLKAKGGITASFSPLQTFPAFPVSPDGDVDASAVDVFENVCFLCEGDPEALKSAKEIAAALKANLRYVEKDKKVFYHIAGVAASNFLISILKLAERQLNRAKTAGETVSINDLLPLVRQTLNNVEKRGVEASLTGPFKRKEMGIIAKHLEMLDNKDDALLYKTLTHYLGVKESGVKE